MKVELSELNKRIDAWAKRGSAWTKEGQALGLLALGRLSEHGDIGPVNRLFNAMPKGTKSSAMASWLLAYGALQANTDKATKADKPFVFDREKQTDTAGASADPWFDHKPEPAPDEIFDLQKALASVLKKAAKSTNLVHAELLEGIRALVGDEIAAEAGKGGAENAADAETAVGEASM